MDVIEDVIDFPVEGDEEEVEDIGEGGNEAKVDKQIKEKVDKQIEAFEEQKNLLNSKLYFIEKLLDACDSDNEGSILKYKFQ